MKIRNLNGELVKWTPKSTSSKDTRAKSSLHEKARELISAKYPTRQYLEEVQIPIRKYEYLYLDFYNPLNKTAIEVHGEQHFNFIPYFHSNIQGFIKQKKRDTEKYLWCEQNNIELIILGYDNIKDWETLI